ncbi:TetR/AcrR family transcriptional regulator C-terminal domain-containing protein [Algihabitans albus]|uniref:TetR/AcrR family transcriptional regulator n=1 Tax=Algihabitans albus TaxID=2164067 RepID=UPI0035CEA1D0
MKSAVALLEDEGEQGFSIRKVGSRVGCDPMAVLYHFKSKAGLEQAMADALNAELTPVDATAPWRARLSALASQYRALALRYPRTFPLLLRFWVTGPADYRHAEMIYQALSDAGFEDRQTVDICFGFYASILGLAAAEVGGMLQPATAENLAEARSLPAADFPMTRRLLPAFEAQRPAEIYALMVETVLNGIEQLRDAPTDSRVGG